MFMPYDRLIWICIAEIEPDEKRYMDEKGIKTKWRCYENTAILGTLRLCFYCVFELPRIITVKEYYRYERNKMFAMLYFKY